MGEPVLPAANAPIDAPLRRHPKLPWYQLSNLRMSGGAFPSNDLSVDFRRLKSSRNNSTMPAARPSSKKSNRATCPQSHDFTSRFQILEQRGDRFIDRSGIVLVPCFNLPC
jgi:hypothetical protein